MNEERLQRLLRAADDAIVPAPQFAADLLADLRGELGFVVPTGPATRPRTPALERPTRRGRSRLAELLMVAALAVATLLGLAIASGAIHVKLPALQGDALTRIQSFGRIRIAVRPDHPQFSTAGQPAAGFDADVAQEIAKHMRLAPVLVIVPADAMRTDGSGIAWDVGLPSSPTWLIDPSQFEVSSIYYRWPHRVVVAEGSTASTLADLAGRSVCAVAGDAGEAWLAGRDGNGAATAVPVMVLAKASDDDCLVALSEGSAAGAVTARLSDADIAVRPGVRVLDPGPVPESRVAIVPRLQGGDGRSTLLEAIDAVFQSMHADGTLTRLSQNRFGGADLTQP